MYSAFDHWAYWSQMLTVISMFLPCTQWVFGPLSPVSPTCHAVIPSSQKNNLWRKRREYLLFLLEGAQYQSRRQGSGVPHRHDLCSWPPRLATIPDPVVQESTEDQIPNQTGRTPLFPQSRCLDSLSPNLIREKQSWEAVVQPATLTNHRIILVADVVQRVISDIACPEHDLCAHGQ